MRYSCVMSFDFRRRSRLREYSLNHNFEKAKT